MHGETTYEVLKLTHLSSLCISIFFRCIFFIFNWHSIVYNFLHELECFTIFLREQYS